MRVIIEARENGNNYQVALDVETKNWHSEERNAADRRQGILDATNALLRTFELPEIKEES